MSDSTVRRSVYTIRLTHGMNVTAAPFSPKMSKQLAAARLLVRSIQAELEAAKAALNELEFAENCQPCKPQLAAPVKRCAYCTGRHSNYAGIGGCAALLQLALRIPDPVPGAMRK